MPNTNNKGRMAPKESKYNEVNIPIQRVELVRPEGFHSTKRRVRVRDTREEGKFPKYLRKEIEMDTSKESTNGG